MSSVINVQPPLCETPRKRRKVTVRSRHNLLKDYHPKDNYDMLNDINTNLLLHSLLFGEDDDDDEYDFFKDLDFIPLMTHEEKNCTLKLLENRYVPIDIQDRIIRIFKVKRFFCRLDTEISKHTPV